MKFLADESCDFRVVKALKGAGHDVVAVAEVARGAPDDVVIQRARADRRILLTEDRDFGRLVFADRVGGSVGVLYMRCPESARSFLPEQVVAVVVQVGAGLEESFAVWTPNRVRLRRPREE